MDITTSTATPNFSEKKLNCSYDEPLTFEVAVNVGKKTRLRFLFEE